MHPLAAGAIVGTVIKRAAEGDCPTIAAFSVETLEETLIEVNRMFQAEQKVREKLETALRTYGRHTNDCDTQRDWSWMNSHLRDNCTCGLRALIQSFSSDRGEKR